MSVLITKYFVSENADGYSRVSGTAFIYPFPVSQKYNLCFNLSMLLQKSNIREDFLPYRHDIFFIRCGG